MQHIGTLDLADNYFCKVSIIFSQKSDIFLCFWKWIQIANSRPISRSEEEGSSSTDDLIVSELTNCLTFFPFLGRARRRKWI